MSLRGGKRPGAGRKNGSKNKTSLAEALNAMAQGLTPLEHMLNVLRDENQPIERRDWAAEKAAPYMHPRLQSHEVSGRDGGAVKLIIER